MSAKTNADRVRYWKSVRSYEDYLVRRIDAKRVRPAGGR